MASAALAAITGILFFSIYWCSGWSQINCWTREINIQTGHQRYTRYWFWCVTEQRVEPTWISETLTTPVPSSTVNPGWHLVATLSPGTGHSPHYVFHGALGDLQSIEQLVTLVPAEKDAQRSLASSILWLWQAFDDDSEAGSYISDVSSAALKVDQLRLSEVPKLNDWLIARRTNLTAADLGSPYAEKLDAVIARLTAPQGRKTP
jgi:hypothetical protein